MTLEPYERCVKKLCKKDWTRLSDLWLAEISKLQFAQPGHQPEFGFDEVVGLQLAVRPATDQLRIELPNLAAPLIHEAIYLLHKAANVLVAAHDQVVGGLPTWSLATGYQGAIFAAEAVTKLLGVGVVTYEKKNYTVDVWPNPVDGLSKKKQVEYQYGSEAHVVAFPAMSHFHRWAIFKRLLGTLKNFDFDPQIQTALLELDQKSFAKQRNELHYSHTWEFEDIHEYRTEATLLEFGTKQEFIERLNPESPHFGIALGLSVFALAMRMLKYLAASSPLVATERTLLLTACSPPRFKLRASFEGATGCSFD